MTMLKRKRAGLGDAMAVVTRFVNACNRHDADEVYACLHPDFDSIQPMHPSRNFRGADQVRRNWQAIFDAEPGFRLTVLRSAAMDDTVWLELHGAGRDAEVAGVFVMGILGDRIRWARIYSALVEAVAAAPGQAATASAPLREVPRPDQPATAGNGEVVEEALIAPVVDIERSSRRRRTSRTDDDTDSDEPEPEEPEVVDDVVVVEEIVEEMVVTDEPAPEPQAEAEAEVLVEPMMKGSVATDAQADVVIDPAPVPDDVVPWEPESEPADDDEPPTDDRPRRLFGKKRSTE